MVYDGLLITNVYLPLSNTCKNILSDINDSISNLKSMRLCENIRMNKFTFIQKHLNRLMLDNGSKLSYSLAGYGPHSRSEQVGIFNTFILLCGCQANGFSANSVLVMVLLHTLICDTTVNISERAYP